MTAWLWIEGCVACIDAVDYRWCRQANRGASHRMVCPIFRVASRLGDGIVWHVLLALGVLAKR